MLDTRQVCSSRRLFLASSPGVTFRDHLGILVGAASRCVVMVFEMVCGLDTPLLRHVVVLDDWLETVRSS